MTFTLPPTQPVLVTPRLVLRPFVMSDAPMIQRMAGRREIAATTLRMPHPYVDGLAEKWISGLPLGYEKKVEAIFAITLAASGLVGSIGLVFCEEHLRAELGYWIGVPFWNHGYCTEAARAVLDFAFDQCCLHRVVAHHFANNPSSGKVLQKLGMRHEGTLPDHILKWNQWETVEVYGILTSQQQVARV